MFPFPHHHHDYPSKDWDFQISSSADTPYQEDFVQLQDLNRHHLILPSDQDLLQGRRPNLLSDINNKSEENNTNNSVAADPNERKMMRRDNERQRRQAMAIHTASLRSLLPHELIKGKRSISEHINGAVDYIKQLKEKIQDLNAKKEELKGASGRLHDFSMQEINNGNLGSSSCNIMVGPTCWGGVEIVVSTSEQLQGFPLSRVLKSLLAEGLTVVECASTAVNQRLFHTIQCEVEILACLDLSELQQKLNFSCSSS